MRRTRITDITLKQVGQKFGDGEPLIKEIDMTMPLGKIMVLEGSPGCGKTILMRIMAGLNEPTHGDVFYNGTPLSEMSFEEFIPLRMSTSFCFENGGLMSNRTVLENLKLPLLYHKQWRAERGDKLLTDLVDHFELGAFLHLKPSAVSSGVRKIAGIVRSFLTKAQIIFLDEPGLGVGRSGSKALNYWLEKHRQEKKHDEMVVITTHDAQYLDRLECVRYRLRNGILVENADGAVAGADHQKMELTGLKKDSA